VFIFVCDSGSTDTYCGCNQLGPGGRPQIMKKSGQALATWHLSKEYGFTDVDGTQPDWGSYASRKLGFEMGWIAHDLATGNRSSPAYDSAGSQTMRRVPIPSPFSRSKSETLDRIGLIASGSD
jgi:hypothetical protein